jgi:hypothetical protein
MGNFNPDKPNILGMEWVAISERQRPLDIFTEVGYGFTVTGAPFSVVTAVEQIFSPAVNVVEGSTKFYSFYQRGREDDTGEINVIRLTPSSVTATGAVFVTGTGGIPVSPTLAQRVGTVDSAADLKYVQFSATTDRIRVNFAAPAFLDGKRILGLDFVYQAFGTPGFAFYPSLETVTDTYPYDTFSGPASLEEAQAQTYIMGEVNPFSRLNILPTTLTEAIRYPFRYEELVNLGTAGSPALFVGVHVDNLPLNGVAGVGFIALDVYYCEESRIGYGGEIWSPTSGLSTDMVTADTFATNITLPAGDYTVTVTQADGGSRYNNAGFLVPELTEYRGGVSSHPAVETRKFQRPVGPIPARNPVTSQTDEMVAMVPVTLPTGVALQFGDAPVPYISIVGAPVYISPAGTSVTATQQIHNEASPGDTSYEWLRFYARRFNPSGKGDLTITVAGSTAVKITAAEFAALDEITVGENGAGTGWREVTLPITAVFSSDASFRNVVFSMTGVTTGEPVDQYQILTARSTQPPSYGVLPSYTKSVYDGAQNATATYKIPEGTGVVSNADSTMVVMFSQAAPPVTGFAVTGSGCAVEVTPIGDGCAPSACIPTHILGNRLAWRFGQHDDFQRELTDSWGVATSGQAYTLDGGTNPGNYDVNGSQGTQTNDSVNVYRSSILNLGSVDFTIEVDFVVPTVAVGASLSGWVAGRHTDASNYYAAVMEQTTLGDMRLMISRRVAGVLGSVTSGVILGAHAAGDIWRVRFQGSGSVLQAKAWKVGEPEPSGWSTSGVDTNLTTGTNVALMTRRESGNSNGTVVFAWDNLCAVPDGHAESTIEIQRMDEVDDEWQTIAELSPCVSQMCDFEARVGMTSWYRTRVVNLLDVPGPWVTGSAYLTSPAVSGVGDGNSVLIFTSNQDTAASLAYVKQFEGEPIEEFVFPEAGFQQLRTQYQRDFFVAFRPTERGGEQFTAEILVHAAAIPPESLANFRSLRDLAWESLPYVCVRDELGNRWFANVAVPSGKVRNNRTIYIASVTVTEVTDTPAPWEG